MALKFNPFTGTLDYVSKIGEILKAKKPLGITGEEIEIEKGAEQTVLQTFGGLVQFKLIQNGNIELAANIEEAKLLLPEVIKKTTEQEMTGKKIIRKLNVPDFIQVAGVTADTVVQLEILGENLSWEPAASTFYAVKPAAGAKLQGINIKAVGEAAIQPGTFITIFNEGTNVLLIEDNVLAATATLRIRTHAEKTVELGLKETVSFVYFASRWRQFFTQPIVGEGLELANAKEFKIKPAGITEAMLAEEAVGFKKLGFFNDDAPIEIPAGKTYEVPENIQGLWKESISVQGTLNIQGRFDEVGVAYGGSMEIGEIFPDGKPLALGKPKDFNLLNSQTDWSRPKEEPSLWYRPNATTKTVAIEGIESAGFADGTAFFITNRGAFNVRLLNNAAGPTETDRFFLPNEEEVVIGKYHTVGVIYNGGEKRWNLLSRGHNSVTLVEVEERAKEFKEAIKLAKTLTIEETLKVKKETTLEGELKARGGLTVEASLILPAESITTTFIKAEAVTEPKIGILAVSTAKIASEAVTPAKLSQFSREAPWEIAAGTTCEVPELYQGLFKENLSVQGTLNIQGRFDEVGTPEQVETNIATVVPTEVLAGKSYEVPGNFSVLWRDNISVQGTMNVQGRLTEI